jgi:hypothetical protein
MVEKVHHNLNNDDGKDEREKVNAIDGRQNGPVGRDNRLGHAGYQTRKRVIHERRDKHADYPQNYPQHHQDKQDK